MRIELPSSSLKDHVGDRWTFIGEDGFKALKEYLTRRLPLDDEDYVFVSEKKGLVQGKQFTVASVSTKFARVIQKLDMAKAREGKPKRIRMHGLRKFFRNNIRADSAYIKFWMGHSLGTDAHYISRDLEKHREEYRKGYPFLRIYETVDDLVSLREEIRKRDEEIEDLKSNFDSRLEIMEKQFKAIQEQLRKMTDSKT
jgi:hypothetical protein